VAIAQVVAVPAAAGIAQAVEPMAKAAVDTAKAAVATATAPTEAASADIEAVAMDLASARAAAKAPACPILTPASNTPKYKTIVGQRATRQTLLPAQTPSAAILAQQAAAALALETAAAALEAVAVVAEVAPEAAVAAAPEVAVAAPAAATLRLERLPVTRRPRVLTPVRLHHPLL